MRLATYEHLIARRGCRRPGGPRRGRDAWTGRRPRRRRRPGRRSTRWSSRRPGQVVVVKPSEGAGIGSWDIRAVRHALGAVLRRRPGGLPRDAGGARASARASGARRETATARASGPSTIASPPRSPASPAGSTTTPTSGAPAWSTSCPPATTPGAFARAEIEELGRLRRPAVRGAGGRGRGRRRPRPRRARAATSRTPAGPVPGAGREARSTSAGDRRTPTLALEVSLENLGAGARRRSSSRSSGPRRCSAAGRTRPPTTSLDGERVAHDGTAGRAALASLRSGQRLRGPRRRDRR